MECLLFMHLQKFSQKNNLKNPYELTYSSESQSRIAYFHGLSICGDEYIFTCSFLSQITKLHTQELTRYLVVLFCLIVIDGTTERGMEKWRFLPCLARFISSLINYGIKWRGDYYVQEIINNLV